MVNDEGKFTEKKTSRLCSNKKSHEFYHREKVKVVDYIGIKDSHLRSILCPRATDLFAHSFHLINSIGLDKFYQMDRKS
ncbi:CLUMA_CG010773, isoform A [Clunio marinus]|uniref:CLUMA_CG010773, isoform A n=1 Tax=Clunio marinus TaxID=568069 RepID=A0A1J1IAS0_9DIPT|nr:CLUMA_CG010773, isoform A [Clunio marinus]